MRQQVWWSSADAAGLRSETTLVTGATKCLLAELGLGTRGPGSPRA